ncbi:hypothetical protein MTO96_006118 [Rhipicephalus appendiculatus]
MILFYGEKKQKLHSVSAASFAVGSLHLNKCFQEQPPYRINCLPDVKATPDACSQRRCCWKTTNKAVIPRCHMKPRRVRYAMVNRTSTGYGQRLQLKLVDSWSERRGESKRLTVDVVQFARDTARVRIFDPSKKESEPPVPAVIPEYQSSIVSYTFALKNNGSLVITPTAGSNAQFEVFLQSTFYADKAKQLAINLRSGQYFYGLRGPRGAPFVRAGRWSKHKFYHSENPGDYTDKDSNVTLGLFFLTGHDIELTLSSASIATFRTTGGLLDVFFFFGPDPMSVAKQYLRLVGFPYLPSLLLLKNGICRPIVYFLDGGVDNSTTLDIQGIYGEDIFPSRKGTRRQQCGKNAEGRKPAQLYDLTHPRGAYSFQEMLSDQDLEYAVDYQGTLVLGRPECVDDGNASAHMLNASTYSDLGNAYETILAKATYRSISKSAAQLHLLLVQNTFPGAGRWSGYWNPDRNPYKRSVQDMLLHNIMGMPAYGTAPCRLSDVVNARVYRACSRLAHLSIYFPVHRRTDNRVIVHPDKQPRNESSKYEAMLKEATSLAAKLRASLLPYTLTALFPSDNNVHAFTRQFMYGPHLLVVPGTKLRASSELLKVYFPRGVWYEPHGGHRIQSLGQTFFVPESNRSVAPFFARAGSIVPLAITGGIQLQIFLDNDEQAAGDLFQLPQKATAAPSSALQGALTGHCTPCAVYTMLSSITLYGLKRRPSAVEINGRPLPFSITGRLLVAEGVNHDATSPFLITVS